MPKLAVMWSEAAAGELKVRVADLPVRILHGMDGLWNWRRWKAMKYW